MYWDTSSKKLSETPATTFSVIPIKQTDTAANKDTLIKSFVSHSAIMDRELSGFARFHLAEFFQYVSQHEAHMERMREAFVSLRCFEVETLWAAVKSGS